MRGIMLQAGVKHQDFTVQLLQVLSGEYPEQLRMLNLLPAFPALSFHWILNQVKRNQSCLIRSETSRCLKADQ